MKEINVLVTAAGNVFMPGTLACLKDNGERSIRVIGADMNEDSTILQMCDEAYQVPGCADPSYVDDLLDIFYTLMDGGNISSDDLMERLIYAEDASEEAYARWGDPVRCMSE